ncbi:hypothetical protein ACGGAQ_31640 [Micromonospora sp. NPDC047557]|uniref:hypothetical protein n=1 Tax=Micromonospora sp. NPDC047557 TaxID=3364250 RepID=UPI00370FEC19
MTRLRAAALAVACFLLGVASASWVAFLMWQGLDKSDKWSSVAGVMLTVAFGIGSLWASRRGTDTQAAGPTSPATAEDPAASLASLPPAAGQAAPSPSGGSVFNVNATTAYNAHEMTVHHYDED